MLVGSVLCPAAPCPAGSGVEGLSLLWLLALSPAAFVPVSMLLPIAFLGQERPCGLCLPPYGAGRLGLVPRDWFGDSRDCLGSGCRGMHSFHSWSSPTAWLGAAAHTCAPARGGGTSPVSSLSVSPVVCFSVASAICALGRSAGHM